MKRRHLGKEVKSTFLLYPKIWFTPITLALTLEARVDNIQKVLRRFTNTEFTIEKGKGHYRLKDQSKGNIV